MDGSVGYDLYAAFLTPPPPVVIIICTWFKQACSVTQQCIFALFHMIIH